MITEEKFPKISLNICCLKKAEEFPIIWTQKRVRISHGKRVIGVRVIEVLLDFGSFCLGTKISSHFGFEMAGIDCVSDTKSRNNWLNLTMLSIL